MKLKLSLLLIIVLISTFAFSLFADDLAVDEGKTNTFASKRGVKKDKLRVANIDNLKMILFNNNKKLNNFDQVASGQQFFFNIKTLKDSYYYIFILDSVDKVFKIHTSAQNFLKSNEDLVLPKDGEAFEFDSNMGIEQVYIFVTAEKNEQLEDLSNRISEDGTLANENIKNVLNNKDNNLKIDSSNEKILAKRIILIHKHKIDDPVNNELLDKANNLKKSGL